LSALDLPQDVAVEEQLLRVLAAVVAAPLERVAGPAAEELGVLAADRPVVAVRLETLEDARSAEDRAGLADEGLARLRGDLHPSVDARGEAERRAGGLTGDDRGDVLPGLEDERTLADDQHRSRSDGVAVVDGEVRRVDEVGRADDEADREPVDEGPHRVEDAALRRGRGDDLVRVPPGPNHERDPTPRGEVAIELAGRSGGAGRHHRQQAEDDEGGHDRAANR
jgi:hypothetical protein